MTVGLKFRNASVLLTAAVLCSACLGGGGEDGGGSSNPPPASNNRAPAISGTPPANLNAGSLYDFRPSASDPDGDALTFSIQGKPLWATFDPATGRLYGTPGTADVGLFTNVLLSVSDGRASAQLPTFAIAVNQISFGSVTLSWTPPTTNSDGSTITDLAGYKIYYGQSSSALNQVVTVSNPGTIRWVVDNLSTATWYFTMTSYNASGIESMRSGVASRSVT